MSNRPIDENMVTFLLPANIKKKKGKLMSNALLFCKETGEKIALKECQINTSDKMRTWWNAEVDIMGKLEHDNLIRALPVPPDLAPEPSQPPVLAMEFCEGGDLRKVCTSDIPLT